MMQSAGPVFDVAWQSSHLQAQCLGQDAVVADGKSLQIPQALASTQDSEHGHEQQVPGREPNPAPHPSVWDRPEVADQIKMVFD